MSAIDSSLYDKVILVDPDDKVIGTEEKLKAHQSGLLHRAFSVCVLRRNGAGFDILLQQRAQGKYHSGGLWTNTCCSHPQPNEDTLTAAERRLNEEMGIIAPLSWVDSFIYRATLDNGLTEHELDHVFVAVITEDSEIKANPDEVMAYRWVNLATLADEVAANPARYTAWLDQVLDITLKYIGYINHS